MEFFDTIKEWLTYDRLLSLIDQYQAFGLGVAFLLPFLDAFLLVFPFFIVIVANIAAFGFWTGVLVSWAGNVCGTLLVFYLVRRFGQGRINRFLYKPGKTHPVMNWADRSGFGPIFLVLCLPFTPSFVVNIFAGLSRVRVVPYFLAVILGKFVMVLTVGYVGKDLHSLITNPLKTALIVLVMIMLWAIGKRLERKMI